jgi:hypothetical protein
MLASFTGLSNNQHQVVCSMAAGGQFVVVDAFVYVQKRVVHCITIFMSLIPQLYRRRSGRHPTDYLCNNGFYNNNISFVPDNIIVNPNSLIIRQAI